MNQNYKSYNNKGSKPPKYQFTLEFTEKIQNANSLVDILTIEEINLPNRASYKIAEEVKRDLKTNQLRKIFEQIKDCEKYLPNLNETKAELYKSLPLIAYAVGRDNCPKAFFNLLKECISDKKLKTVDDVHRLIEFLTAIVAYVKFFGEK